MYGEEGDRKLTDIIGSIENEIKRLNVEIDELQKDPKQIIVTGCKVMIVQSLERIRDDALELGK